MINRGYLYIDRVTGLCTGHYRDRLGRHWMAHGVWGLYRRELVNPRRVGQNESEEKGYCFIWEKRIKVCG